MLLTGTLSQQQKTGFLEAAKVTFTSPLQWTLFRMWGTGGSLGLGTLTHLPPPPVSREGREHYTLVVRYLYFSSLSHHQKKNLIIAIIAPLMELESYSLMRLTQKRVTKTGNNSCKNLLLLEIFYFCEDGRWGLGNTEYPYVAMYNAHSLAQMCEGKIRTRIIHG